MRKSFGPVLVGLGAFLLVLAVLAATWMPGKVKKTPLNVNSATFLAGTVKKLDTATGQLLENPVKVWNHTESMGKLANGTVAVWLTKTCVLIDTDNPPNCVEGTDDRLVTASVETWASNRITGLGVGDYAKLPADSGQYTGLVNKWPFGVEKKTYPYWDGLTGKAVDAKYAGTKKLNGFETYVFKTSITAAPIEIVDGVPGTYDDTKEIYVDPTTGSIINQAEHQQRTLADGTPALDLQIVETDAQIKKNIDDAKANISKLNVILKVVPIGGGVLGLLALLVGLTLMRRWRAAQ